MSNFSLKIYLKNIKLILLKTIKKINKIEEKINILVVTSLFAKSNTPYSHKYKYLLLIMQWYSQLWVYYP